MIAAAPIERTIELTNVLHYEAAVLDDGKFEDWLALLHPEVRYVAPVRIDVSPSDQEAPKHSLSFFHDDLMSLSGRVAKLRTGLMQTEYPPSRVVRLIASILVAPEEADGVQPVRSAFLVYRQHRQRDVEMLAGHRHDQWVKLDGAWRLKRREIAFAANVLPAKSLPLFY
jgi:3-phenylpropionate/cinnamic acid dioxygenase small subunit